ncbi:MBL fold metallo-hydrolase [Microbacterium sp. SA39]|uniref:MBL fold metallo-hydrolase n=1 Tax=Microbacterium sp. SA39 TaxID=1263625 RepID=UPI0005F9F03F|nr:MBL fold metallo-hydrolase [Microbacterium sp. SA39]KJQ52704.1 metal-dependent hydrolase [Microbacterium sp. SA39]
MRIRKLGWAGVEIEHDGQILVIDLLEEKAPLGEALTLDQPLPPPSRTGEIDLALVSHLHGDHTDPAALQRALRPGARVFRPVAGRGPFAQEPSALHMEDSLRSHGLRTEQVEEWDSRTVGAFRVTAVPAVDALGDPQVSWVVEAGGVRVFHGGDTMFHGFWWGIRDFVGRIDVALLPINGPVLEGVPGHSPSSPVPAVLLPEQAAIAAQILGAHTAMPIHYGLDRPPLYAQTPDAVGRFERSARERGITPVVRQPGGHVTVA